MNSCNFIGNVGKTGEIRYTSGGTAVLQFSIAVTSGYGDNEITTWINCNLFGKRAESLKSRVNKGQRIGVSGDIANRKYQKDGQDRYSLELNVSNVTLLVDRTGNNSQTDVSGNASNNNRSQRDNERHDASNFDDMDQDIPF
jgi:single-strand DNA-binding protein